MDLSDFTGITERMGQFIGSLRPRDLSVVLDISEQAVSQALKKKRIPEKWIYKLSSKFDLSPRWLASGEGPMRPGESAVFAERERRPSHFGTSSARMPVLALAQCGLSGWSNVGPLAMRVGFPDTPGMFAVIAVGTSMQPEGIREGYLLFCDPDLLPREGDAVFVERRDGTVSIKKLQKIDATWLHLQGWLPPDANEQQAPYNEKHLRETIKRIACVVLVQRRA